MRLKPQAGTPGLWTRHWPALLQAHLSFFLFLAGNFRVCRQEGKMKEDCPPSSHVPISDCKSILK